MSTKETLADKQWKGETGAFIGKVYLEKDVKAFIARVKERIKNSQEFFNLIEKITYEDWILRIIDEESGFS